MRRISRRCDSLRQCRCDLYLRLSVDGPHLPGIGLTKSDRQLRGGDFARQPPAEPLLFRGRGCAGIGVSSAGTPSGVRCLRSELSSSDVCFRGRLGIPRGGAPPTQQCAETRSPTAAASAPAHLGLANSNVAAPIWLSGSIFEADSHVPTRRAIRNSIVLDTQ